MAIFLCDAGGDSPNEREDRVEGVGPKGRVERLGHRDIGNCHREVAEQKAAYELPTGAHSTPPGE